MHTLPCRRHDLPDESPSGHTEPPSDSDQAEDYDDQAKLPSSSEDDCGSNGEASDSDEALGRGRRRRAAAKPKAEPSRKQPSRHGSAATKDLREDPDDGAHLNCNKHIK